MKLSLGEKLIASETDLFSIILALSCFRFVCVAKGVDGRYLNLDGQRSTVFKQGDLAISPFMEKLRQTATGVGTVVGVNVYADGTFGDNL